MNDNNHFGNGSGMGPGNMYPHQQRMQGHGPHQHGGMGYGYGNNQAAATAPPPAQILPQGPTQNLWLRELRNQVDPIEAARFEQWARQTGQSLNWGLPLRPHIYVLHQEKIERESADDDRRFTLKMNFGFPVFVKAITFAAPQMQLSEFQGNAVLPDPTYFAGTALRPADFVEFSLRRSNNEVFTAGDDEGFATASTWMGTGELPYQTLLYLFFQAQETIVLDGRVAKCVEVVESIKVYLHCLQVPPGVQING